MNKKQLVDLFYKSIMHKSASNFRKNDYGDELSLTYTIRSERLGGDSLGKITLYCESRLDKAFEEISKGIVKPVEYIIKLNQYKERADSFKCELLEKEFFDMVRLFKERKEKQEKNMLKEANEESLPYLERLSDLFDLDIVPKTRIVLFEKYNENLEDDYEF